MAKFLTLGEPLVVLASQDVDVPLDFAAHFTKFIAGAELNVALGIRRLGHEATYVSKVGTDSFGRFIIENARSAGLDVADLTSSSDLTGFYLKQKVSTGDPAVAYFRKNSAASNLSAAEISDAVFDGTVLAHLTGIFPALSKTALETFKIFNQKLNERQILTVFDPNLRPALWNSPEEMVRTINALAQNSQIILPGINEGEMLMGSRHPEAIADFYLNQSELTQTVIVKLGSEGAFVKHKSGAHFTVEGFKVTEVVDTVGAGDGFAVGLESALLEQKPLEIAVHRACAIGALAVQTAGDNDGYPTRAGLAAFYQKYNYKGDL